jgi:hypothetical protein
LSSGCATGISIVNGRARGIALPGRSTRHLTGARIDDAMKKERGLRSRG